MKSNESNSQSCLLPNMFYLADNRSHGLLLSGLPHPGTDGSGSDEAISGHTLCFACWSLASTMVNMCASVPSVPPLILFTTLQHTVSGQVDLLCPWIVPSVCSSCVLYFLLYLQQNLQKRGWCAP